MMINHHQIRIQRFFTRQCHKTIRIIGAITPQTTFRRAGELRQNRAVFGNFNTFGQIPGFRGVAPFAHFG